MDLEWGFGVDVEGGWLDSEGWPFDDGKQVVEGGVMVEPALTQERVPHADAGMRHQRLPASARVEIEHHVGVNRNRLSRAHGARFAPQRHACGEEMGGHDTSSGRKAGAERRSQHHVGDGYDLELDHDVRAGPAVPAALTRHVSSHVPRDRDTLHVHERLRVPGRGHEHEAREREHDKRWRHRLHSSVMPR